MLPTSETYQTLLRDPNHRKEIQLVIDGVPYRRGLRNLHTASIRRELLTASMPIGNACAARLTALILPGQTIQRMARVEAYVALSSGDTMSEWIPAGVYFIDTRSREGDFLRITCYDSMLKAEAQYFMEGEWEDQSMLATAQEIAGRMGVELDSRTAVSDVYMVRWPNDATMREVLAYIAAAHGGNWVITAENKLRLVPYGDVPAETDYIVDEHGDAILIGGVRIRWR